MPVTRFLSVRGIRRERGLRPMPDYPWTGVLSRWLSCRGLQRSVWPDGNVLRWSSEEFQRCWYQDWCFLWPECPAWLAYHLRYPDLPWMLWYVLLLPARRYGQNMFLLHAWMGIRDCGTVLHHLWWAAALLYQYPVCRQETDFLQKQNL